MKNRRSTKTAFARCNKNELMNKTEIENAFKRFEKKYNLPPILQMANGPTLGAFILTKDGESFMINAESKQDDIAEAARMINPDNVDIAAKDLNALKALCSPLFPSMPAPQALQ